MGPLAHTSIDRGQSWRRTPCLVGAVASQAALARYRALSPQTLGAFAANWLRDPAQRKLFEGMELDELGVWAPEPGVR